MLRQQKLRGSRRDARALQHPNLALLRADVQAHDLVADPIQLSHGGQGKLPNFRIAVNAGALKPAWQNRYGTELARLPTIDLLDPRDFGEQP